MSYVKKGVEYSKDEDQLLLEIAANYHPIIDSKKPGIGEWKKREMAWTRITNEFNNRSSGRRSSKALKGHYEMKLRNSSFGQTASTSKLHVNDDGDGDDGDTSVFHDSMDDSDYSNASVLKDSHVTTMTISERVSGDFTPAQVRHSTSHCSDSEPDNSVMTNISLQIAKHRLKSLINESKQLSKIRTLQIEWEKAKNSLMKLKRVNLELDIQIKKAMVKKGIKN